MAGTYSVYRLCFSDGHVYVGMTSQSVSDRVRQHMQVSSNGDLRHRLINGMLNGVEVLAAGLDKSSALIAERRHIQATENSLNIVHTDKARALVRPAPWRFVAKMSVEDRGHICSLIRHRGWSISWLLTKLILLWAKDPGRFNLEEGKVNA